MSNTNNDTTTQSMTATATRKRGYSGGSKTTIKIENNCINGENTSINSLPTNNHNNTNIAIMKCETCGQSSQTPARYCSDCGRRKSSAQTIDSFTQTDCFTQTESATQTGEQLPKFTRNPQYVMFGTYQCKPKNIEFYTHGIRVNNVSTNNLETRSKYRITIPYVDIIDFYYCTDDQQPILFIKITNELNRKIRNHLDLGEESRSGVKFNTNSADVREHLIIAVFNYRLSYEFVATLVNMMRITNKFINIKELSVIESKLMVLGVQTIQPWIDTGFAKKRKI